jgi:hypothetical protein
MNFNESRHWGLYTKQQRYALSQTKKHVYSPMTRHKWLLTCTFPRRSFRHAGRYASLSVQYKTIVSKIWKTSKKKDIFLKLWSLWKVLTSDFNPTIYPSIHLRVFSMPYFCKYFCFPLHQGSWDSKFIFIYAYNSFIFFPLFILVHITYTTEFLLFFVS